MWEVGSFPCYYDKGRFEASDASLEVLQSLEQVEVVHPFPETRLIAVPLLRGEKEVEFGVLA